MTFSQTLSAMVKRSASAIGPTLRRFWSSVALSVALTGTVIANISREGSFIEENLTKLSLCLFAEIIISWCVILYLESRSEESKTYYSSHKRNLVALGASILLGALFYVMLDGLTFVPGVRHLCITASLLLLFLVIPNLNKEKGFEMYLVRLFLQLVIAVIFSGVVFLGLAAAVFTVSSLFSLNVFYDFYLKLFVGVFGILGSFLFMAGIPEPGEDISYETYPKVLKSLMTNVVTPLLLLYAAILFVYFAKILITWQWPVGLVSNLVIWYALVGTGVFLFIQPIAHESRWAEIFSKYFPIAIIPLLGMMFVSMGIRVKYYGITESRYYVLLIGLWLLGSMIYLVFSHKKRNAMLIFALAVLIALSTVGPWSAFSVSKWSQNKRLEGICAKYDMVQEGALTPSDKVSQEDRKEISAVIAYFERYHTLEDVKLLPDDFTLDAFRELFGFEYDPYGRSYVIDIEGPEETDLSLSIAGYDYLFQFKGPAYSKGPKSRLSQGDVSIEYDVDRQVLTACFKGNEEWSVSLKDHIFEIVGGSEAGTYVTLNPQDMIIEAQSQNLRIKVIMHEFYGGLDPSSGEVLIYNVGVSVLVGVSST